MKAYVSAAPGHMGGQVCIGDTRITTATMRALRDERGLDLDAIKALYPYLSREQIELALWWEDEGFSAPSVELVQALLQSENLVDLLRCVLGEYLQGNTIGDDGYWYSPDENGEPHYRNHPATGEEQALVYGLRKEVGL